MKNNKMNKKFKKIYLMKNKIKNRMRLIIMKK